MSNPIGEPPCKNHCEAAAFSIEIRSLRGELLRGAAELTKVIQSDDITSDLDKQIYKILMQLRSTALSGPRLEEIRDDD